MAGKKDRILLIVALLAILAVAGIGIKWYLDFEASKREASESAERMYDAQLQRANAVKDHLKEIDAKY